MQPFVDLQIEPGAQWKSYLRQKVEGCTHFILILSTNTLKSEFTKQELIWAIAGQCRIIPILHNGFRYSEEVGKLELLPEMRDAIQASQWIEVKREAAEDYQIALDKLVNQFGIIP